MIGTTNSNNFMPQSNWEQNDPKALDYIKGRPFYINNQQVLIDESNVYNFDYLPEATYELGKTYIIEINGVRSYYEFTIAEMNLSSSDNFGYRVGFNIAAVNQEYYMEDEMRGDYFLWGTEDYLMDDFDPSIKNYTVSLQIYSLKDVNLFNSIRILDVDVQELDPIYLPELYCTTDVLIEKELIYEKTFEMEEQEDYYYGSELESWIDWGKQYAVYLNGERYIGTAWRTYGNSVCIGDGSIDGILTKQNELPFLIEGGYYGPTYLHISKSVFSGITCDVKIYLVDYAVNPIPEKYIKNSNIVNGTGYRSIRLDVDSNEASGRRTASFGSGTLAKGESSLAEGYGSISYGENSHAEGRFSKALGYISHAEGVSTVAYGYYSHSEGDGNFSWLNVTGAADTKTYTVSSMPSDIAVGNIIYFPRVTDEERENGATKIVSIDKTANTITLNYTLTWMEDLNEEEVICQTSGYASGEASHSEGYNTKAEGDYSHAEGYKTMASGAASHAEGNKTIALGKYSHAEGHSTEATGGYAHAQGSFTVASGYSSSAEGEETRATETNQHVQGLYNYVDESGSAGDLAHIVGNGNPTTRSNAHTLDWDGNAWFAGDVYVGSTSGTNKDEGSKKLITADEAVSTATFTYTIPTTMWYTSESTGGLYTVYEGTVEGILATDNPVCDVVLGQDPDANALYKETWAAIDRIETKDGSVIFYKNPDGNLAVATPIQIKVVR